MSKYVANVWPGISSKKPSCFHVDSANLCSATISHISPVQKETVATVRKNVRIFFHQYKGKVKKFWKSQELGPKSL